MSLKSYTTPCKIIWKLGHVTLDGHFARKNFTLEMALIYNNSQSKKLLPKMSLDERLNICARALLNNLLKI